MAYKPLDIETVKLDDLNLDLNNYRVPVPSADETSAMKYLFASEDVFGAAKLILRNGYFDNEIPVVLASSAHRHRPPYVVLEGNRRVCALKAMRDPDLVPSHATEIRSLLKRHALEAENLPREIRVMVAPSKELAIPHIARLHTGLSKRAWSPDQQANFYYSLLDASTSAEDVKANFPGISVPRYFRMASMRQFLSGAQFEDRSLRDYVRSDDLKMSVLEYAYKVGAIADLVGVNFDRNGLMVPATTPPAEIGSALGAKELSALEYLVNEFRAERLTTRSDAFKKGNQAQVHLIEALAKSSVEAGVPGGLHSAPSVDSGQQVTSGSRVGGIASTTTDRENRVSVDEVTSNGGASARDGAASSSRGPNRSHTKKKLSMEGVDYSGTPVNLEHRYQELRRIDIDDLPLTAAILMRSVLETTAKYHFENTSTPATGELKSVLDTVYNAYGREKTVRAPISLVRSGASHQPGSLIWFNRAAHDVDATVTTDEVRQAWRAINPLIRHLLR